MHAFLAEQGRTWTNSQTYWQLYDQRQRLLRLYRAAGSKGAKTCFAGLLVEVQLALATRHQQAARG